MGSRRALVERHRVELTELAHAHRGLSVALFGSAARGEDLPGSDIDLLVEFEPGSSLFDHEASNRAGSSLSPVDAAQVWALAADDVPKLVASLGGEDD